MNFRLPNLLTTTLLAATLLMTAGGAHAGPWRCQSKDINGNFWFSRPFGIQQNAINQAYFRCKNLSPRPMTCRVARVWCSRLGRGRIVVRPPEFVWHCLALDLRRARFRSHGFPRWRAENRTMRYCENNSPFPGSCRLRRCWRL